MIKHKKKLGQNFLKNQEILQKISDLIFIEEPDSILEIGAGSGFLTEKILTKNIPVIAIELDKRWCNILQEKFANYKHFTLLNEDILKLDWKKLPLGKKCALVGNLPYQISSPIFFSLLQNQELYNFFLIMLQKEFADRIIGDKKKSKKNIGSLSILAKLFFQLEASIPVNKKNFFPIPKVDSKIIKMKKTGFQLLDLEDFCIFLRQFFLYPRKTLWNNLKTQYSMQLTNFSNEQQKNFQKMRAADFNEQEILKLYYQFKK